MGSSGADTKRDSSADGRTRGRRVVYAISAASVGTAAVFGLVLGFALAAQGGPAVGSFGPLSFALTPLNLAVFGMVMVGPLLAIGLFLVNAVSKRTA